MAFDFPASPAVGDEFTSGGATYTFTAAGTWDLGGTGVLTDYVLKAGDTMLGPLNFMSDGFNIFSDTHFKVNAPAGAKHYWYINGLEKARLEGDATPGNFIVQGHIYAQGGGRFIFNNTDNNAWQNALSMNGGIHLQYHQGGNNDGRLRVFTSNGGYSDAYVFETTIVSGAPGIIVNGNCSAGSLTSRGGGTFSTGIYIGNNVTVTTHNDLSKHIKLWNNPSGGGFGFTISSGTLNYISDVIGSVHKFWGGNEPFATINQSAITTHSYRATTPEATKLGADLGVPCEKDGDMGDSVDVVKMIAALLLKVTALEGEIATLKKARR